MMNWWFDKGIDGFRVDAITHIKKTFEAGIYQFQLVNPMHLPLMLI